jgi:hypothetical protein
MTILYWPFEEALQFYPTLDSTGSPQDQLSSFEPDIGPAITRRRTTARVDLWNMGIYFQTYAQFATFEAWFHDTIEAGALTFIWRHPSTQSVKRFKFAPATYQPSYLGGEVVRIGFSVMILPGQVPLAPYIAAASARVPDWVADYTADKYWIAGVPVAATALAGITGNYLVLEQRGLYSQRFLTRAYDGDVPQTAPTGVAWLAGFLQ